MQVFFNLLLLGIGVAIIVYVVSRKKRKREEEAAQEEQRKEMEEDARKKLEARLKIEWERKETELKNNGLPILNVNTLQLTKDEICHFEGEASFCKARQQTIGYEGGSRGISLRVMKGLSYRVGNYQGHYVKEEITEKADGVIYLTSKKIIFDAPQKFCVIKYKDIIKLNAVDNMLQIRTEGKEYLFQIVKTLDFMCILEFILNKKEEDEIDKKEQYD